MTPQYRLEAISITSLLALRFGEKTKFTIYHSFIASVALHLAVGLLLTVPGPPSLPKEPRTLVVHLLGVVAERQAEEKIQQETRDQTRRTPAAKAAAPADLPKQAATSLPPFAESMQIPSSPEAASNPAADEARLSAGADESQNAQTIKDRATEADRIRDYAKLLTKRVQAHHTYLDEWRQGGLQGTTTVSFTILQTGQIRPESLKVIASSGQAKLDASALKTVRSSAPFDPPPRELTVTIPFVFGPRR